MDTSLVDGVGKCGALLSTKLVTDFRTWQTGESSQFRSTSAFPMDQTRQIYQDLPGSTGTPQLTEEPRALDLGRPMLIHQLPSKAQLDLAGQYAII